MIRPLRFILAGLTAAAATAGCTAPPSTTNPPIQQRVTLSPMASCDDLERTIEDTAVREMAQTIEMMKQNQYWGWGFAEDGRGGPVAAPTAGANGGGAGSAPAAHTTTNNQVKGVDEADFVKNDGTRLFALSGRRLHATRTWPPQDLALAGSLDIEGYPSAMFLDEHDRVVVLSYVYTQLPGIAIKSSSDGSGGGAAPAFDCTASALDCGYYYANTTKVTVVDVSRLDALRVVDEVYLPGSYVNARRIGSSVRLVLSDWFRYPEGVRTWLEYDPANPTKWEDQALRNAAYDAMKAENERLIRAQSLRGWLPPARRKTESGAIIDVGYSCGEFYAQNAPSHLGMVSVVTLNLDQAAAQPQRATILAEPGEVYASTSSLYVASQHWWWWPAPGQEDFTYIHKFDITDPSAARYVASGGVAGHLVDQFSLDEHRGFLRAATTIATRVPDTQNPQNPWGRLETTNRVSVLGESGGALTVVGRTPDLATGERIMSARFVGDQGYVVTFRQVDPLFTLDLSTPTAPVVRGELKVPGFSTYIHPLDAGHLLTIGTSVPDPGPDGRVDWSQRALKLSIFDVTDLAQPKESFTQLVGTAHGWSEAAYEHKAFNYFAERGLLAIPFSDYTQTSGSSWWDTFVSDLRVFSVDAQRGFIARGSLSMKDLYYSESDPGFTYWWSPEIRRSVMAADAQGNDFVYAVSDAGVRVAPVMNMAQPLATATFPRQ
jgi:hypothetical protein